MYWEKEDNAGTYWKAGQVLESGGGIGFHEQSCVGGRWKERWGLGDADLPHIQSFHIQT